MSLLGNISSLMAGNKLVRTENEVQKNLEKLSSGLKINKSADDTAGLAISSKMKAQIQGLGQAQDNIQDGISLIQTAEGGLGEINGYLHRIRELSIQSANDSLVDEDREKIQKEVEQLMCGINDIANNTHFNGIQLLNVPDEKITGVSSGTFETMTSVIDLSKITSVTLYEVTGSTSYNIAEFTLEQLITGVTWTPPYYPPGTGEEYFFKIDIANNTITSTAKGTDGFSSLNNIAGVRLNGITGYDVTETWADNVVSYTGNVRYPINNSLGEPPAPPFSTGVGYSEFSGSGDTSITWNFSAKKEITEGEGQETSPQTLVFQVGPNQEDIFYVKLTDARTQAIGVDGIKMKPREEADKAIGTVDEALEIIISERTKYGVYQNALEHIFSKVSTYENNLAHAESRIRDANMAEEMIKLAKNNILSQSAQSMLAHANGQQESVLALFK